jgi:hypothetical protein
MCAQFQYFSEIVSAHRTVMYDERRAKERRQRQSNGTASLRHPGFHSPSSRLDLVSRSSSFFGRQIRCIHIGDGESLPESQRRANDRRPRSLGDSQPATPSVDRIWFLIQGGRQGGVTAENRKYVVKGLHRPNALTDYLSVQERTEKQVTPLFRQLTMLPMKGQRKASVPSQLRRDFIARVKKARMDSGKKPIEVAADLGVALDTYLRWENRALLPHHMIWPFCRSTGTDPVLLLSGSPLDLGKLLSGPRRV